MIAQTVPPFAYVGKVRRSGSSGLALSHGCAIVAAGWQARPAMGSSADAERGARVLSVAVLEAEGSGLAELIAGQADVAVERTTSIEELTALVAGRTLNAILVDPDLPEGWPTSIATEITEKLASTLPVVMVCQSAHELEVIRRAVIGRAVVVARNALDREGLVAILHGEVAKRQANSASS
jgi:hypothetical protein